jgi:hypothetical protein
VNAYCQGRFAATYFGSPSLNKFPDGSLQSAEWDRGWRSKTSERVAELDAERRQRAGSLAASACTEIGT